MSNQEILEKAIQKAVDGGWNIYSTGFTFPDLLAQNLSTSPTSSNLNSIIFNHDFAKALWGEERKHMVGVSIYDAAWKVHLQLMVISPDPIKYLGENL